MLHGFLALGPNNSIYSYIDNGMKDFIKFVCLQFEPRTSEQ